MVRSPGFGSTTCNSLQAFARIAHLRLGFPPAPGLLSLNLAAYRNSQAHSTKGTPSQGFPCSDLLWAYGFRFFFTPLTGVLFTFPSRYFFTIGSRIVFSLGSWSTQLPTRFLGPRRTQNTNPRSRNYFGYGTLTPSGRPSHAVPLYFRFLTSRALAHRSNLRRLPPVSNGVHLTLTWVWALSRSLAAT